MLNVPQFGLDQAHVGVEQALVVLLRTHLLHVGQQGVRVGHVLLEAFQVLHAAAQDAADGQVEVLALESLAELAQPGDGFLRRIALLVIGDQVQEGLAHAIPVVAHAAAGEDLHALFQAEIIVGVQGHHRQQLHLAVEGSPVFRLEGGLAVVGKERQVQPGWMAADGQPAGSRDRIAVGMGGHHRVEEGAVVGAFHAGMLGDEGGQLLQGEGRLIVLRLVKPLAVIQQQPAQADHILLGAEDADAGAVEVSHGILLKGSLTRYLW